MQSRLTDDIRADIAALRPIIQAARADADQLRRLPDPVAQAFVDRDVYRMLLPRDLGGRGVDPLMVFDAILEVAAIDGSVGWNYAIGSHCGMIAATLPADRARALFADRTTAIAGSGPPQGKAVRVDGGYRVTGTFAWASGVCQSNWALGGCFVHDGDARATGPGGLPIVVHALVPKEDFTILDAWHVGGMRGTGSTQFRVDDVFVPTERALTLFGGEPAHPDPLFRLPTTFFGFALSAVPLGIAREAIAGLKALAMHRPPQPPRPRLIDQAQLHYVVAKAEAMVEAALLGSRTAFAELWAMVRADGGATMEARARLRRATVHAVETAIDAVQLCYRTAGGAALFESAPFERALRDVNAAGGHIVFQRAMMEDAGRVALGLKPLLAMF